MVLRLTELDGRLIGGFTVAAAIGVRFVCPGCAAHFIQIDFDQNRVALPPSWTASGKTIEDLSVYPSIQLLYACGWHGEISNGNVHTLPT